MRKWNSSEKKMIESKRIRGKKNPLDDKEKSRPYICGIITAIYKAIIHCRCHRCCLHCGSETMHCNGWWCTNPRTWFIKKDHMTSYNLNWLRGCMVAWYDCVVGSYDCMVVWYDCMVLWYDCMVVWYNGMVVWYDYMVVWHGCMIWLYGCMIWLHNCILWCYGCMDAWYDCMVALYDCMVAWYDCMVAWLQNDGRYGGNIGQRTT